jgi:hypothetical protein
MPTCWKRSKSHVKDTIHPHRSLSLIKDGSKPIGGGKPRPIHAPPTSIPNQINQRFLFSFFSFFAFFTNIYALLHCFLLYISVFRGLFFHDLVVNDDVKDIYSASLMWLCPTAPDTPPPSSWWGFRRCHWRTARRRQVSFCCHTINEDRSVKKTGRKKEKNENHIQ